MTYCVVLNFEFGIMISANTNYLLQNGGYADTIYAYISVEWNITHPEE